jgi:PAS domain S-box-containing protein
MESRQSALPAPGRLGLAATDDHLRQFSEMLPTGFWMTGVGGECTHVNGACLAIIGRRLDQVLGRDWHDGVHPNDRERRLECYRNAWSARAPFSVEYRVRRRDGTYRWCVEDGAPRYDARGAFLGYIGGLTGVTDRTAQPATRELARRLIGAQEKERARIGRELHDNVSQRLAMLSIEIDQLGKALPEGADTLAAGIARLRTRARDVAREVHGLSHQLHPVTMKALGLVPALRAHCDEVSRHSIAVQFSDANMQDEITGDTALCAFRIAQEALANVVKHSGATAARVMISGGDHQLVLRIEDGGRGFDRGTRRAGLGLVSMRERVHSLGGRIHVRSTPNHGTVVEAHLPVHQAPARAARRLSGA